MNGEAFYREIGYIDDDLIQAANEAHRQKRKPPTFYHIVGIAACFCLICCSIIFALQKDTFYINDISTPTASKVVVPAGENTEIIPMTYEELLAYYGITQLPNVIGEELTRTEQSYFVLYQDRNGTVIYDANILYYSNTDNSEMISITFAKAEEPASISHEKMRWSRVDGVSVLLAASSTNTGHTAYCANFKLNGVSVQMISNGLSKDQFIHVVKVFIQLLK